MHERAAQWDKDNARVASAYHIEGDTLIPKNRPCDWCGKPVDLGYIHTDCKAAEAAFYIDLLY